MAAQKVSNSNHERERQDFSEGTWHYSKEEKAQGRCTPAPGRGTSFVAEMSSKLESTRKWSHPTNKSELISAASWNYTFQM